VATRVVGLLLAAGAGRRMGGPKALVRGDDGTAWVVRAARDLRSAGCDPVRVVVGAAAAEVTALLAADQDLPVDLVVAADWSQGMGASLRAGLDGLSRLVPDAQAALVHLVDLPDVGVDVLTRVASLAAPDVLARATYAGRPGHPVLLGRDHWTAVAAGARGDAGARGYLAEREVLAVDCSDLASGTDVDTR
jgi:CTP:molybdopterin cytidylyltransferase MocA